MRHRLFALTLLAAGAALFSNPLLAQEGTVEGKVVYTDRQPATFVDVILEGAGQSKTLSTNTDDQGLFRFVGVPVGKWKLSANESGKTSEIIEFELGSNQKLSFTITLRAIAAQEAVVTVRAKTERTLDTKATETKTSLDSEFINKLPLQNKRLQDLVFLAPGVTRVGSSDSAEISVQGGTSSQIGYRLDGVSFNDVVSGGPAGSVSTAAIDRFELIQGGFQAEYGQQSTGIANIITKSGTNKVEFSYGMTYRDTEFDTRVFGRALNAATLGTLDAITGELSQLVDTQETVDQIINGTDPFTSGAIRKHFGGYPSTLDDDNNPVPRLQIQHQLSVGGPIKRDKVFFFTAVDVLQRDTGSAFLNDEVQYDSTSLFGKVTWDLRTGRKMWAEGNFQVEDQNKQYVSPFIIDDVVPDYTSGTYSVSLHDKHVFAAKAGFLKDSFLENTLAINRRYITQRPPGNEVGSQTTISVPPGGTFVLVEGNPDQNYDRSYTQYTIGTDFTKNFKSHVFKLGGELTYIEFGGLSESGLALNDVRIANGFQPNTPPTGSYGNAVNYGDAVRSALDDREFSIYAQDSWSVTRLLSLDIGMRMDYQKFIGKILTAPRFGFSLDPVGNQRTRFYGSWGHFYDNVLLSAFDWKLQPEVTVSNVLPGRGDWRQATFDKMRFEDLYTIALGSSRFDEDAIAYLDPTSRTFFGLADDLTSPKNVAWQVGIQRNLPAALNLQIYYSEAERDNQLQGQNYLIEVPVPGSTIPPVYEQRLESTGLEEFKGWTISLQKAFAKRWDMFLSYQQQTSRGPIYPPADPLDPIGSLTSVDAVLGRDRTHVAKANFNFELPWKIRLSASYRYQTGTPLSPYFVQPILTGLGQTVTRRVYPLGFNTIRLPADRGLDLTFTRGFKPAWGDLETRVSVFNVTNEYNVYSGNGIFEPIDQPDPANHPPYRPGILPLGIDIGRTVEFEFRLRF